VLLYFFFFFFALLFFFFCETVKTGAKFGGAVCEEAIFKERIGAMLRQHVRVGYIILLLKLI
jgi:hypothetical protein